MRSPPRRRRSDSPKWTDRPTTVSTSRELLSRASDLPRHEAERLLVAATGWERSRLSGGETVDAPAEEAFTAMLERRRSGEPLQYIEGTVQFGPLELAIDPRALIPRPETEQLWELVARRTATPPDVVVDLCTGSGNLALACKHTWPDALVLATDLSPDAVALARENASRLHLDIDVRAGDLFAPLPSAVRGRVDLLVANPPYVAADELETLPTEVRDHEPTMALVAGPRGDEILARIARDAIDWMRPGGVVAVEISEFGAPEVASLFAAFDAEILDDLTGTPRFVVGAMPGPVAS